MVRVAPRFRTLGLLLVACALALRLVVAPGFMPVVGGDGGITISMCTGAGAVDVRIPGKPDMPMPEGKGCAFASLALAAPPETPLALLSPPGVAPVAVAVSPLAVRPHIGVPAPPPPAIGPPAFA